MFDPIKALLKNTNLEVKRDQGGQAELEAYCRANGILGINGGNMDPLTLMRMIKARRGDRTPTINEVAKKQVLNG